MLTGISLGVAEDTVTGLLGPSGSGKSTLIRSIVGVQRITSGSVQVLGLPAGSASLRAKVGYVTQELSVYRDLTVRANLGYFASVLGVDGRQLIRSSTTCRSRQIECPRGQPVGRSAVARLAGDRTARRSPRPDPGRAHGWAGPGASRGSLVALPSARGVGRNPSYLQPCHGGGDALSALAAPPRRPLPTNAAPEGLLRRTDESDMDAAFLHLIRQSEATA